VSAVGAACCLYESNDDRHSRCCLLFCVVRRDALFSFPASSDGAASSSSSSPPLPCAVLLSQHKWAQMISGATGVAPTSSSVSPKLLQEAADYVAALNATHAASNAPVRILFAMEFVTNRDCPEVDVDAIPEGILLVSRENWVDAMGPVFGTRNLQHHVDVQHVAMEQQQQLRASGGFHFPPPRASTDGFKETTCVCGGDCATTADCACVRKKKACHSSCHFHAGLPQSGTPSHSQCKNLLNASAPSSLIPLQHAQRGQSGCSCATGCALKSCGCRKAGVACTTACHGFHGHDLCTNRSARTSTSATQKKRPGAENDEEQARAAKKGKGQA
jgi:hypothetical protein